MPENKTKATNASVAAFLAKQPEARRQECQTLLEMMRKITGEEPKLWGSSLIGFGQYHYVYESGREGDSFLTGFSPRKQNLTVYINGGFEPHAALLKDLGKYKLGKVCLYINKLEDVNLPTLRKLITASFKQTKKAHKA
jgi:hypothetical protein